MSSARLPCSCSMQNGQCRCRTHMTGRQCTQVESGYFFMALDYYLYEAELAPVGQVGVCYCSCWCLNSFRLSVLVSCVCVRRQGWSLDIREHQPGRPASWTGLGFARVSEGGTLEFHINNVPYSMEYDLLIRYESQVCACVCGWGICSKLRPQLSKSGIESVFFVPDRHVKLPEIKDGVCVGQVFFFSSECKNILYQIIKLLSETEGLNIS